MHEFLHYFIYINKVEVTEETVNRLAIHLAVLSLGHLKGAGEEDTEEDKADFQQWIDRYFKNRPVQKR